MSCQETFSPDYAVPPGETLQETMTVMGIERQQLAQLLGKTLEFINNLMKGRNVITAKIAIQLEEITDVPATFWNKLELNYQELLTKPTTQFKASKI